MQFEEALEELERINERLERNQVTLENAIRLYERGMKLIDHCEKRLNEARGDIKKLTGKEADEQLEDLDV
ncbi:MAG: exodeoxyribonuclease VII small subunit [Candidatus Saliniplasma sp.]